MPKKGTDNPAVTRAFCDERFGQFSERVFEKLSAIDKKVDKIKTKEEKESEEETRDWRKFLMTIGSGGIVALIALIIAYFFPH